MSIAALYCIVSFIVGRRQAAALSYRPTSGAFLLASIIFIFQFSLFNCATAQDTVHRLDEVQVSEQRTPSTLRTAAPTQVLDAEKITNQGAVQVSDAVKMMAGVTLKDYGGVGGIKTVSARGLGSQFSTLTIDGVAVDDAQNGQVDLGRYLLGNAAYVSLSHGTGDSRNPLSARACATGSVINLETAEPTFFMAERTNLRLGFEGGSFGLVSPTLLWEQKWSKKLKMSLWANYLKSNGDYPFTLYYTAGHTDSSSRERRHHSAMRMFTSDVNLFYSINSHNHLTAKVHYMRGQHQLPGPVQYYTQLVSAEQTEEEVAFAQARWNITHGEWQMQAIGKIQSLYDLWEDSAANTASGYQGNTYLQREAYGSFAANRRLGHGFSLNMAADGSVSRLINNKEYCNNVLRWALMGVAEVRYSHGPADVRMHLLGTSVTDNVLSENRAQGSKNKDATTPNSVVCRRLGRQLRTPNSPQFRHLSPYIGAFLSLAEGTTLRLFYKEVYRVPNFGELYFFPEDTMPHNLRPERAHQLNIGLTHASAWENGSLSATADAYYNRVSDKIIAIPGRSMFLWTMINEGIVDILGLDATVEFRIKNLEFRSNYTFQHAVVHTDPNETKTYGCQIAYTPRHSGGFSARWENRWVNIGASAMLVGHRFSSNHNTVATRLPAYADLGLTVDRSFDLRLGTLRLAAHVLNLLDTQYEVVQSYPMMGRNFKFSVTYEF
ncbi:MAG: TonB-dependent receptor [Bacteroidales bacterium]|nr:TonB-dependent receptor [Bacteroidales bacterium]